MIWSFLVGSSGWTAPCCIVTTWQVRCSTEQRDMKEESNMTHADVKPPPLFRHTHIHTQVVYGDTRWYNSFCLVRLLKYKGYCTAKLFTLTPLCTQHTQREVFWSDNCLWVNGFVWLRNALSWWLWEILQFCVFLRVGILFGVQVQVHFVM